LMFKFTNTILEVKLLLTINNHIQVFLEKNNLIADPFLIGSKIL